VADVKTIPYIRCHAKSKTTGQQCQRPAMIGKRVCYHHGGATPTGIHASRYKHGRYSRVVPTGLLAKYIEAYTDPAWLSLRSEIAVLLARMQEHIAKAEWAQFDQLAEQLRKLQDSEMKKHEQAQRMISLDKVLLIVDRLLDAVRSNVKDEGVLKAIQQDLAKLLGPVPGAEEIES
jgi:hypothetical protein